MDHSAEKQNEVEKNADSLIQAAPVNGNNKTQNTTKTRDPKSKNEQEVFRGVPVTNNDIKVSYLTCWIMINFISKFHSMINSYDVYLVSRNCQAR